VSGRRTLAVHRVTLRSDRLPEAFDGLRIAQFTDLHIGTLVDPDREMRALVDSLNALRPDLVIFCGDLVNIRYTELDSTAMRLLGGIRSRYGTFSITGNHDTGNYVRDTLSLPPATNIAALVERQRAMGWRVLDNETVYLRRGDDSIALSGISYDRSLARQRHDRTLPGYDFGTTYRDVPQELYNITAAHIPQLWEQILDAGYGDLTLSGHVHSMQCKIRLFGRAFSPAQLMYRHWSGPYEKQGRTHLYQRRHRICRISHADRCESRNNPVRITTMNVYASVALSGDGYMDDRSPRRLILSTPADWRDVMRLRAWADAILVGAETVRRDDRSLGARRSVPPGAPCGKPAGRPREGHAEPFAATRPRVELLHRRLGRTDRLHRQRCRIAARNSGRNRPYPRPFGGEDPHRTGKAGLRTAARRGRPAHTRPFFCGGARRHAPHGRQSRRPRRRPARPPFRTAFRSGTCPAAPTAGGMEVTTYTLHPDRTEEDLHYLRQAIALSRRCTPCATSYRVGAVIVIRSGDRFTGYTHETSPTHHAEQEAILKATAAGADLHGASIYSSMEPCSTRSSEPESCSELILRHGFSRTVFALYEPSCFVCCEGAVRLRKGGVEVRVYPQLAGEVRAINGHLGLHE